MELKDYPTDPAWIARGRERVAEAVEARWVELQKAMAGCAERDCVYACPQCRPLGTRQPRRYAHDHRCDGYAGSKVVEHGVPLIRSRCCDRRLTWHREQVAREKADRERKGAPAPKLWNEPE